MHTSPGPSCGNILGRPSAGSRPTSDDPPPSARAVGAWAFCLCVLGGCRGPILSVDDAVRFTGEPAVLTAYLEWEPVSPLRADLVNVPVDFHADGRLLGTARTDRNGAATLLADLPPDTRVFEARTMSGRRVFAAQAAVYAWAREQLVVAVDVDNTLAATEYRPLLLSGDVPQTAPYAHAVEALNELSDTYSVVYLTSRPRTLLVKTRAWLQRAGFPRGPLIVAKGLRQAAFQGAFKKAKLAALRQDWPGLLIGFGDRPTDADAYGHNDMLALMIDTGRRHDFGPHALVFSGWEQVLRFFRFHAEQLGSPAGIRAMIQNREPLYEDWSQAR